MKSTDLPRTALSASVLKAGLGLALAGSTLAVTATSAVFTDSTSIGSNAFTLGDVEVSSSVTSGLIAYTTPKMLPGDSTVGAVTITNGGNVEMRYAIASTTTENVLAAQLDVQVWSESAEPDTGGANDTCDASAPATVLYAAGDLGSTTGINLVGDPSQGAQTGDRTLAAAATELLCFKSALPIATGNSYENLSTTATFAISAEQTANNA